MTFPVKAYALVVLFSLLLLPGCSSNSELPPATDTPLQTELQNESIPQTILEQFDTPQTEPTEKSAAPVDNTAPSTDTKGIKIETIRGKDYYNLNGLLYSTELGEPVWGEKVIHTLYAASDISTVKKTITHIGDALSYISNCGIFRSSEEACILLATLLVGDYETVGFIQFNFFDENYYLTYLEHNDIFHIFDPYMCFSAWDINQEKALLCGNNIYELAEKLSASISYYNSSLVDYYISEPLYFRKDILMFWYGNTSFPVKLGLPKLSKVQYAFLAEEKDLDKTERTVTTLADISKVTYGIPYINYSNDDDSYVQEEEQQCILAANWIHHILRNDYEEVGYVYVESSDGYHVFLYIWEDGLYYLIDPREYVMKNGGGAWLASYTSYLTGCGEDFQIIADSIMDIAKNYNSAMPESTDTIHFIRSSGDFFFKKSGSKLIYPHDTEVTVYYGKDFSYADPYYRWES